MPLPSTQLGKPHRIAWLHALLAVPCFYGADRLLSAIFGSWLNGRQIAVLSVLVVVAASSWVLARLLKMYVGSVAARLATEADATARDQRRAAQYTRQLEAKVAALEDAIRHQTASQQHIHREREQLREVRRIAGIAQWEWDAETDRLTGKGGLKALLGAEKATAIDTLEAYIASVPTSDRPALRKCRQAILAGQRDRVELEHRLIGARNTTVHVLLRGEVYRNADGRVTKVSGTLQDITEHRKGERKLRLAAAAIAHAAEALVILDNEKRIVSVNRAFTRITGFSSEEAVGRTPFALLHNPTLRYDAQFFQSIERKLAYGGRWEGEIWARRKNGEEFPQLFSLSAIRDAEHQIASYVAVFNDISDQKEKEERLDYLAHHDTLTGLPNRVSFFGRCDAALEAAERRQRAFAVIYLDLDGFKPVNDTLGHAMGDALLRDVAGRLKACVRNIDTVARLGGDEFAVLVEGLTCPDDAGQIAAKIVKALNQPFRLGDHIVRVGGSAGIAMYPEHGTDVSTLLNHADEALYRVKEAGRNDYRFFAYDDETLGRIAAA